MNSTASEGSLPPTNFCDTTTLAFNREKLEHIVQVTNMDGPSNLRLKRRITELPPDQLFVERSAKRTYHASVDLRAKGFYVRQKQESENGRPSTAPSVQDGRATQSAPTQEQRREYHLARASQDTTSRKRKQNEDLATVVESKKKKFDNHSTSNADPSHDNHDDFKTPASPAPTKRPGRGSALRPRPDKSKPDPAKTENIAARQQAELNALAQEMHQFALDELAKTPKPQIKTKPKLTPSRSRALHQEHTTTTALPHPSASQNKDDEDGGIDSDGEYVYDTYILAPAPLPTPTATTANDAIETPKTLAIPSNVGYLIISEDDEELWENYMHDLEGSDSEPTDEDDENGKFCSCSKKQTQTQNPQPRPKTLTHQKKRKITTAPTTRPTSSPPTTNMTAAPTATAPVAAPTTSSIISTTAATVAAIAAMMTTSRLGATRRSFA